MARGAANKRRSAAPKAALGSGVHLATIEMRAEGCYRIKTSAGERVAAVAADVVEPALLDECLRHGRMVLVVDSDRGPQIVGAVQTARSVGVEPDGALSLAARAVRLKAEETLRIEAGDVAITVDKGVLRLEGNKMVIDMGALIRLVAARVELP